MPWNLQNLVWAHDSQGGSPWTVLTVLSLSTWGQHTQRQNPWCRRAGLCRKDGWAKSNTNVQGNASACTRHWKLSSVAQSCLTLRPHGRPPCPSPTPGVCSDSCPLSWWCHPTISSSVAPSPPAFSLSQHWKLGPTVSTVGPILWEFSGKLSTHCWY